MYFRVENNMTLITPPTYLSSIDAPIIFLAGPIQGAANWQSEATTLIEKIAPQMIVASPRRLKSTRGDFTQEMYNEQVDWETYHLRQAGKSGAILFWLAKEFEHRCDRAYAQTTRFELAEWKMRHERNNAKVVVGIEPGFTGNRYIERRFSQDCPNIPLFQNLDDVCRAAVSAAYSRK
jgi:hypothetical protein